MESDEFELFERLPGGSLSSRGLVRDLESARVGVWLPADEKGCECFARNATTQKIVLARTPRHGGMRVFQVAYDSDLTRQAKLLRHMGYDVSSACGNRVAQYVLCMRPPYELFFVDPSGSERERAEMGFWLRELYPAVRIPGMRERLVAGFTRLNECVAQYQEESHHSAGAGVRASDRPTESMAWLSY